MVRLILDSSVKLSQPNTLYLYLAEASKLRLDVDKTLAELSVYAREKVRRKQGEQLKLRSLAAHACLDWALKKHFELPAGTFDFEENAHGKPRIVTENDVITGFNLSHSGDHIAVAIGPADCQIGIDCETRRKDNPSALINRFFAEPEIAALHQSSPINYTDFLATWTRKEAWVKMLGSGMQHVLSSFVVRTRAELEAQAGWIVTDPAVQYATEKFTGSFTFEDRVPVALACDLNSADVRVEICRLDFLS